MTTPRVTVPVDELAQEIRRVDGNHDLGAGALAEALMPFLSSRLSAAPAPEGGAKHYGDPCVKCGVGHDDVPPGPCRGDGITISRERANALLGYLKNGRGPAGWPTTLWCEVQAFIANIETALAGGEEAPAEAGERDRVKRAIADGFSNGYEQYDDASEMQRLSYDMAADAVLALRAQPPAREDAQPVWVDGVPTKHHAKEWFIAETTFGDRVVLKSLPEEYTYDFKTADDTYIKADRIKRWMPFPDSQYLFPHPAPDALRVAVEALWPRIVAMEDFLNEPQRRSVNEPIEVCDYRHDAYRVWTPLCQALAALQAEQKGGAA